MPTAIRARENGGNSIHARKSFRPATEFRQTRSNGNGNGQPKLPQKPPPPETTNAESFYYLKQMNSKTPMVIVLTDGEEVEGTIEWYDRSALKINRKGAPNIMLLKHNIKYMFKAEDRAGGGDETGD